MSELAYVWPDTWTEADLDALPADGHRFEIIEGSLHVTPPPSAGHQRGVRWLRRALEAAAPDDHEVLDGTGIRVPGGNLIPDLTVLYLPHPQDTDDVVWWEPSDVALVVEVASPSTETNDRATKQVKYAEAGIAAYWRVGLDGTVSVHSLVAEGQYGLIATVRPGTTWTAVQPFEVTLTPPAR